MKPATYTIGTKCYKYFDEEVNGFKFPKLYVARVKEYDEKNDMYKVLVDGKEMQFSRNYFHDNWISLVPDVFVSFNIVNNSNSESNDDVIIMINPVKDKVLDVNPFAICRQDVINIFKITDKNIQVGISINRNNCPEGIEFESFMACTDFIDTTVIAAYKLDDIDDLLSVLDVEKYDKVIKDYKEKHKNDNMKGIAYGLKDLMDKCNFMYDFHESLDIVTAPFKIDPNDKEPIKDIIGQIKSAYISDVVIAEYNETIDTEEFKMDWLLMAPDYTLVEKAYHRLWIVGYVIDPTKDYLTMKYGTNNKDEILNMFGFKSM